MEFAKGDPAQMFFLSVPPEGNVAGPDVALPLQIVAVIKDELDIGVERADFGPAEGAEETIPDGVAHRRAEQLRRSPVMMASMLARRRKNSSLARSTA